MTSRRRFEAEASAASLAIVIRQPVHIPAVSMSRVEVPGGSAAGSRPQTMPTLNQTPSLVTTGGMVSRVSLKRTVPEAGRAKRENSRTPPSRSS